MVEGVSSLSQTGSNTYAEEIIDQVLAHFKVERSKLMSGWKGQPCSEARGYICWRLRKELGLSYGVIGRMLHITKWTAMQSYQRMEDRHGTQAAIDHVPA